VTTPALQELLEQLAKLPPLGEWVTLAACRGEPELFTAYPASKTAAAKVARICDSCPVRSTCDEYASRYDVDGVWAGTWHNTKPGWKATGS
jgi:hypothetical protein